MINFTKKFALGLALLAGANAQAQSRMTSVPDPYYVIINGGLFGGSDYTNVAIYEPQQQTYTVIDTIYVNSVQHAQVYQDLNFSTFELFVAAQDSVVKYDLTARQRAAANAFGSVSTVRVAANDSLVVVGNWYGSSDNNLRIFNRSNLAYIDSVPEIAKGVQDIVIIGDTAYIGQNTNDFSTNFADSLGYISVVRLSTREWLYNDTLNAMGYDLGRMVRLGDSIISVNAVSNTISYYNFATRQSNTVAAPAGVTFGSLATGTSIYYDNSGMYTGGVLPEPITLLPANNALAIYDLRTNTMGRDSFVVHGQTAPFTQSFSYACANCLGEILVARINYTDQSSNEGVIFQANLANTTLDSVGTFPVGYSPEVIVMVPRWSSSVSRVAAPTLKVYPNPTADLVQVELPNSETQTLVLVNTLGQELARQTSQNTASFDLSSYPAGIYWIQARDPQQPNRATATWQRVVKY